MYNTLLLHLIEKINKRSMKPVKAILLFLIAILNLNQLMAQEKNYAAEWKKAEGFLEKGLPQSAYEIVNGIFNDAVNNQNDPQQVKAAFYLMQIKAQVELDHNEKNVTYLDSLIRKTKAPAKNILSSAKAAELEAFFNRNRWKYYNRTQLESETENDINTWSAEKMHREILAAYDASLENEALLKKTSIGAFEPVVIKGNSRNLRPTLYDLLVNRALDYLESDETMLTKPAYAFKLNDEKIFSPAKEFVNLKFATADTISNHHRALVLMQDLLRFHISENNAEAAGDADLRRLRFVYANAVGMDKDKLYEAALIEVGESNYGKEISAAAMLQRAELSLGKGNDWNKQTPLNDFRIKGKNLLEKIISLYPGTRAFANAQNSLNQLLQPNLSIQTEKVVLPNQPYKALLSYTNIKDYNLRLVKIDNIDQFENGENGEKLFDKYVKEKALRSWQQPLPVINDYSKHSVEIKVDALPEGNYLLLGSLNENFSRNNNVVFYKLIQASNLAYVFTQLKNNVSFYALDRKTGSQIPGAQVEAFSRTYDYDTRKYISKSLFKGTTDKQGAVNFPLTRNNILNAFEINYQGSRLKTYEDREYYPWYNNRQQEKDSTVNTYFFTDRSIYRPGQTVYFKGILTRKENSSNEAAVVKDKEIKVALYDVNYQMVDSLQLTSNTYGSIAGSFVLPLGKLNGQFSLRVINGNGSMYFSVEEYKRPKFEVKLDKPKGKYKVNDSVTVSGKATTYAGVPVNNATVVYRVVRKTILPWWFFRSYRIWPPYSREEMEIANGTASTDNAGNFQVSFKAMPDEFIDRKAQPVFNYEVYADVTDNSGETRSANDNVSVSYQSFKIEINGNESIKPSELKDFKVFTKNMNEVFEQASVRLQIESLLSPNKILKERYWPAPDTFLLSKPEHDQIFPDDLYDDEDQPEAWKADKTVYETKDTTTASGDFKMPGSKLPSGWYKITASAIDPSGDTVKDVKYIFIEDDNNPAATKPLAIIPAKNTYQPGETVSYKTYTGFDHIFPVESIIRMDKKPILENKQILFSKPLEGKLNISDADRGGLVIDYVFIKNNRQYALSKTIDIPWSNKQLNVKLITFRDKTLPGAKENWTLKISGEKADKIAAEAMLSMYDASLDQFKNHEWRSFSHLWRSVSNPINWRAGSFAAASGSVFNSSDFKYINEIPVDYDRLAYDPTRYSGYYRASGRANLQRSEMAVSSVATMDAEAAPAPQLPTNYKVAIADSTGDDSFGGAKEDASQQNAPPVQSLRTNLQELAFFYPQLTTDKDGSINFSFTIPEALTTWKFMALAHTAELASGYLEEKTVTQKELMIQLNAPRFMREGDNMEFIAKVSNLSDKELTGTARLDLIDAATGKPVDGWFKNVMPNQYFTVPAGQSVPVQFPITIPFSFNSALTYRVTAETQDGKFTDGEESTLPVLTNRMLVTESLPLNIRNANSRSFTFNKLLQASNSGSLAHQSLTVEFTTNPAWYAVQALPYLMEYPYECSEQIFNRFYANAIASHIVKSMPRIKAVFDQWKTLDTAALMSNLEKNQELKNALLEETPWVLQAQSETKRKQNIARLFETVKLAAAQESTLAKLAEMQTSNGGFTWFKGGPDNWYITQYIVAGIGHLQKLGAIPAESQRVMKNITSKALPYLDSRIQEAYADLIKHKVKLNENNLSYIAAHYLYTRSFFMDVPINKNAKTAFDYYEGQAKKYWLQNSKYVQAMISLALHRNGDKAVPPAIIRSLKENAINDPELGMYFKDYVNRGWFWYQAPIETQSIIIEAFTDIDGNKATINDLKTWLLKQKQVQDWGTTKATAEACYALLLQGDNWLSNQPDVTIQLGNYTLNQSNGTLTTPDGSSRPAEAGTGYFKQTIPGDKVQQGMGNIEVSISGKPTDATAWGAVYWQYFEDLDKITPAATPLQLKKQLFIERNSPTGPVLHEIKNNDELKVGDKVKVRIELRVDRDMEYVHMKDMRSAAMEPVNVLSGYKWQGGLGYYESTRDASTNFFFSWLARGTYVFEYPVFVTHEGNFSNGITTIQCMYAPEFSAHSEGIRVNIAGQ